MDYAQILPRFFLGSYPRNIADIDRLRQEFVPKRCRKIEE